MTIAEAIRAAAETLSKTSDTARLDAELLMAHAKGINRSDLLLRAMQNEAPAGFEALIKRRASHEPVAYITGTQEFYGRSFAVGPGVLIPRGDSETLIDAALETVPNAKRVLDLGTGSGALLITVLLEFEGASGIGIDASEVAVQTARENAQSLGLIGAQARILKRDWRRDGWHRDLGEFDLILCNPPYVEDDAELERDVREFEPGRALFAGPEGLDDYRLLIPQIANHLNEDGAAIFEIGATQAETVTKIAETAGFSVEMRRDLANRPRALVFRT
ncbi:peptide chain release factor N(5)-glutamine methyltransferase [Erythrobacter rubeus]|uniref:Release factor glutamine methyltransferase n=1 Tax=Erythrobacter rubeus TaxID=2760803 RepID=A0ABR8KYZ3_9SPHN|nr:peptide chain release factor N(5)-glutamine methyltransferase [Erythrobacter rubeus]MBD2843447.1 peptide chain release factor N(5)-glutamine methyltransferase [Erythrobacter rubeus]